MKRNYDHASYVKAYHRKRYQIKICQGLLLVSFLFLWEIGTRTQWINGFIFSSPSRILRTGYEMLLDGSLFYHTGITLLETFGSFAIITVLSIGIAILLWQLPMAAKIVEPFFVMLNSLPKSALAPILIVWLGNNQKTIVITAISIAIFGSILTQYTGFVETDEDQIKLLTVMGGSKWQCMGYIVLPASIPLIISTMKVNIGLSLVGVIIGEFLAAKAGLGYLIIYGSQVFKMDWVMLSIVILCMMAGLLYWLINQIQKGA